MMKRSYLLIVGLSCLILNSCFEDQDDNLISASEINDFVWKGMNAFYLYKDNINDLANDRFETNEEYTDYLNSFANPEALFETLVYLPDDVDEFSVLFPNYFELEQILQGTSLSNGMEFGLFRYPDGSDNVFGLVRYILPNTSAEEKGVARGMIFTEVDGQQLSLSNFQGLLFGSNTTYTISLANYLNMGTEDSGDDMLEPTGTSFELTKTAYTENPILIDDVIERNGINIGYLMYNGFRSSNASLSELNAVFGRFSSQGVNELVLDLRYNGGGSVDTAIWLSSMITGQYTGEVFFEENWNSDIQSFFLANDPEALANRFTDIMIKRDSGGSIVFEEAINSLNLSRVYILTTGSTASASELVINGLNPYIDVIQIGTSTLGKPQASRTIYDSEDFGRLNTNPNHTYALQPLIYESSNIDGFSTYYDGLDPSSGFEQSESLLNMGVLGNINEPLLARAIDDIVGLSRSGIQPSLNLEPISDEVFKHPVTFKMIH
jgi:carboxyl-terminal processing protease